MRDGRSFSLSRKKKKNFFRTCSSRSLFSPFSLQVRRLASCSAFSTARDSWDAGLSGIFVARVLLTAGLGLSIPFVVSDSVEDSSWLSEEEKAWVPAARKEEEEEDEEEGEAREEGGEGGQKRLGGR